MKRPVYKVLAGGTNISDILADFNATIRVTDCEGSASDRVEFTVDDRRGIIAAPTIGSVLQVWLGYGSKLTYMGSYVVDSVDFSGWPQTLTVSANAANQTASLTQRRTEHNEKKTLGDILSKIAGRNGYAPRIASELASILIPYIAQEEESDQSFAQRLARRFGANVSIKDGNLIAVKRGQGGLGPFIIFPGDFGNLITYSVRYSGKANHSEVECGYFDRQRAEFIKVKRPVPRPAQVPPTSASGSPFTVRAPCATKEEAEHMAESTANELARGQATATFEIEGDPDARAEMDIAVQGVRSMVDGSWVAQNVTHDWGTENARTTLTCKPKV